MKKRKRLEMYNYIDLFSGAGGLSLGFDRAEYNNIFSVEYDKACCKTYHLNFPQHNIVCEDIQNIDKSELDRLIGNEEVDVIIGGPPCQGFSKAGNIGRTFVDDPRNALFKEFVRIVDYINPKVFVMENVSAMATHKNGKTLQEIIDSFRKAGGGYNVKWEVLNSADYGVPQERRRIFIVGVNNSIDKEFYFPDKNDQRVNVESAIGDLPRLKSGESSLIENHVAMNHSKQMLEKMSYVKEGGDRNDIPEALRPTSGDIRKYIRYDRKKPSVCVTGDMRKIFHYEQNRALTPRELARLQTFPDDFVFEGTSIQIQQQIGNAVPPTLANKVACRVREILDFAQIS